MEKIRQYFGGAALAWTFMAIWYALGGNEYQLLSISHGILAVICLLAYIAAKLSE